MSVDSWENKSYFLIKHIFSTWTVCLTVMQDSDYNRLKNSTQSNLSWRIHALYTDYKFYILPSVCSLLIYIPLNLSLFPSVFSS